MLVPGDLGFPSLAVVVALLLVVSSLAVPLFTLVVRRRWEFSVARNEEVKRLLKLASEEADRAEIEALQSSWWGDGPEETDAGLGSGSAECYYSCAVCYSPTTTRCSRCKAVRYCSGKCQIVHWRQGHREECYPPKERVDHHRNISRSYAKVCTDEIVEHPIENPCDEPMEHLTNQEGLTKSSSTDILVDEERRFTESPGSSPFSGFSSSITNSESSDDLSVCESVSSVDSGKSSVPLPADVPHQASQTAHFVRLEHKIDRCSPKFAMLVDAMEGSKDSGQLGDRKKIKGGHAISLNRESSLLANGMDKATFSTSNLWSSNLDSDEHKKHMNDRSCNIGLGSAHGSAMPDSKSVVRFSFSLSENATRPVHRQNHKGSSTNMPDNLDKKIKCGSSGDTMLMRNKLSRSASDQGLGGLHHSRSGGTESLLSTSQPVHRQDHKDSSTNMPDNLDKKIKCGSSGDTMLMRNKSSRSASDQGLGGLHHSRSGGTESLLSTSCDADVSSSSHLLSLKNWNSIVSEKPKFREADYTASTTVNRASTNVRHSDSRLKPGKADDGHNGTNVSSQVAGRLPSAKNGLRTSVWRVLDQFKGSVLAKHHRMGVGSDMSERGYVKALLPYESFAKLYYQKGLELRPCGLVNCGNSCYANVVLQCLAFTPPLTAYFLQGLHSEACSRSDWCFTCEFERLVLKFKEGKSHVSPIGIVSHLRNIGSQLGNGREEDAHEFLRCAIDRMQSDFLMAHCKKTAGSKEEEMTLIGLTFGGYLRSKIRCLRCNGKTERRERLMDLTVEIEGDIGTLEEALRRFTGSETLDGENKYQCSRCKTYEKARKKLTVLEAPNILTIAFKRYQSGKFGKLNKAIRFSEIIDLASVMDAWKDGPAAYRLYGVIVHLDVMNSGISGHYVCYVRDTQDRWFKIDDSTVKPAELERVLAKGAYMLLYARCSPQAPRLIHGESSHHYPKHIIATNARSKTPTGIYPSRTPNIDDPISTSYSRSHRPSIPRDDSSSDVSSLFSSNSDESSYSTSSTRDSSSIDNLSDYIFGESGSGWTGSPWSNSSNLNNGSSRVFSR